MGLEWKELAPRKMKVFLSPFEDELFYLIETGHENTYIVVFEDAHGSSLGDSEILSKEEIEYKFNIEL